MNGVVLSLFPGIGLLDRAFEEEGFCVVRGPDVLWGGDVRTFHPPAGKFDGVIGGPPCQRFSPLAALVRHNGLEQAENLIPEFERCIDEAAPAWFLMENVRAAPLPLVEGYTVQSELVRDHWCGGETMRLRRFSFGHSATRPLGRFHVQTLALHRADPECAALASGSEWARKAGRRAGTKSKAVLAGHLRKQGLPPDFLSDSPFTIEGKVKVVGNGVPLALGRAVARAVKAAIAQRSEAAPVKRTSE